MFSCDEEPLSPEEQAAQDLADDPRPKLLMSMSDDLELTIKVQKFEETVSSMTFEIIYNPDALEVASYSGVDFGNPWSNMNVMDVNNNEKEGCSIGMDITQQPSVIYISHNTLNAIKCHVCVRSVVKSKKNTAYNQNNKKN